MKSEFLKLAGVKSEKAFYKKYPNEAAFFKAHPEAKKMVKKAQAGTIMSGMSSYLQGMQGAQNIPNMQNVIQGQMQSPGVNAGMFSGQQVDNSVSTINASQLADNKSGYVSPGGPNTNVEKMNKIGEQIGKFAPLAGQLISGYQNLRAGRRAKKEAQKWAAVTDVQARASETQDIDDFRQYAENARKRRDAFMPEMTGEEFFPVYGVGTNVLAKDGKLIKKAQDGVDATPTNWYEEGMDKDTYYALKKQLEEAGYKSIAKPEKANMKEMQEINKYQSDSNQISEDRPGGMMGREQMIPEVNAKSPVQEKSSSFDSKSARDNWVQKTGLPWSEAKRLGYTDGSAKDNIKLLGELNDPRFRKENIRTVPPKKSSQSRTPIQHRNTPTGKLTPIKKAMTLDDFYKSKGWNTSKKYQGPEFKQDKKGSYQRELDAKRAQAEYSDQLDLELPLYYLANPGKAFGDFKNWLNPNTPENETSEPFRKQVMSNRYNKSISDKERSARHRQMGYDLVPEAAINTAAVLSASPYTTYEAMPIGIGEAAGPRAAGYVTQGAKRLTQGAPKMLNQPYTPNFVMYQNGGSIGGNPTEIQNTYTPGTLYDDLGYEPLNDSNQVKSYKMGGHLPKAAGGAELFDPSSMMSSMGGGATPWGAIGGMGSSVAGNMTGNDGGGQIGGAIGGAAGSAFGPAGQAIGQTLGTLAGGLLDTNDRDQRKAEARTKNNINRMIASQFSSDYLHPRFGSNMKDGGWVSHDWQPQVIAKFGDLDAQDFADFAHKDQFRAGGHLKAYREPSERAMQTYDMGGELQTHWGGYAEPMSENPYLPGGGETVMFRGKSHEESDGKGNTGIGITFGDSPVEVERGEPAVKLKDGSSGEDNLVVYGNLKIPNEYVSIIGDPKAKGKKFKNYVADLSKVEQKQNKIVEKSTNELNELDVKTPFDKLKLSSLEANVKGGNMKLKSIADKKIKAADLQSAINDTAEEYGLVADDLARGKVKFDKEAMKAQAKYGAAIKKAQGGGKVKFNSEKEALAAGYSKGPDGTFYRIIPPEKSEPVETKVGEAMKEIPLQRKDDSGLYGGVTGEKLAQAQRNNPWFDWAGFNPTSKADVERFQRAFNEKAKAIGSSARLKEDGLFGQQTASALIDEKRKVQPTVGTREEAEILESSTQPVPYKRSALLDIFGQILPYIRPTDQEELNPRQLMGELYALSTNKLEPVQAQPYSPQLRVPYDISLQDQLNEITASERAAQRMMGYNPAAQANLAAQTYGAKSKVLADQFRMNQAMKDQIYSGNIATLNDAELKNLDIYDQQYQRQEQAKSNTKATAQAALNSIADKYAKNALENRELGIYENLYNYRYDKSGRAVNMNAPFQPNIPTVASNAGTQRQVPVYEADGKTIKYYQLEEYDPNDTTEPGSTATPGIVAKTGKSIKKNNKNSSIVKAIKNL
jgi:hypothetical protein